MSESETASATAPDAETTNEITEWPGTYAALASIFHPLEGGFPIRTTGVTAGSQLAELRYLDDIVVAFDEAIDHSDAGLDRFRELHKRAIDDGIAALPTWPRLKRMNRNKGVMEWDDTAWATRYAYLVHARVTLTQMRLKEIGIHPTDVKWFFRGEPERPCRKTLVRRARCGAGSATLLDEWWRGLDDLLQDLATQLRPDERVMVSRFWDSRYSPDEDVKMEF